MVEKNENLIKKSVKDNKPTNRTIHKGRKKDYESIHWRKNIRFIVLNINTKKSITVLSLITLCDKLIPEKSKDNSMTKYMRIYRFIKIHCFSVRKPTRQGHLFPKY